jgi:hypothetical protein
MPSNSNENGWLREPSHPFEFSRAIQNYFFFAAFLAAFFGAAFFGAAFFAAAFLAMSLVLPKGCVVSSRGYRELVIDGDGPRLG